MTAEHFAIAVVGAEAMTKVDTGEPTTELEDKIILCAAGRMMRRGFKAKAAERAAQEQQLPVAA